MTDYVREKGEEGGRGFLSYFYDKGGGGWFGYRGLFAVLLSSPQLGLFAYWITYTSVTLSSGMFYLTLIPFLIAIPLIALLPGKSGITPKRLGILLSWHLYHIHFMTGPGFLSILQLGSPSGITGLTGGPAYWEVQALSSLRKPNRRTCSPYPARGGFAMAYYILVRRVTLLSAFAFSWAMTVIY